ncbi:MAG: sarcosine oxidase subunit alpha family protein [Woeseia sp.]
MSQPYRLPPGNDQDAVIDRSLTLRFTFNGKELSGHPGDSLASALLANGVHLVARSFKYHRPRGIMAAGVEEPNAMVQLGRGARSTPNLKATEVALYDGLSAQSVNVFPGVGFDAGAIAGSLSRVMPAGFYYKTFFGSPFLWHRLFEPLIRRAGGWGKAPTGPDPDYYDRMHEHCDVLVAGGGAAGLMAARTAAASGARVVLADEGEVFGGRLLDAGSAEEQRGAAMRAEPVDGHHPVIEGLSGPAWARRLLDDLARRENVRLLPRTTIFGYYDGNYMTALQRRVAAGQPSSAVKSRERLWHFRARRVILATGAHERPLVFANNDRPGIMLAGAVQAYLNRWRVLPGKQVLLFTNNHRAYGAALDLLAAGARIRAVCDSRADPGGPLVDAVREAGVEIRAAQAVTDTRGRKRISGAAVAPLAPGGSGLAGPAQWIACDLLVVSGGMSPAVHLHSQSSGKLKYDSAQSAFLPEPSDSHACIGACNGTFPVHEALREGAEAGRRAAKDCGFDAGAADLPEVRETPAEPPSPLWLVPDGKPRGKGKSKHFVDLQNDTTAADIRLAVQEGFQSVEHMKRYTLTGFGTDQGKTSNINGLAILAEYLGEPIADVGTTTFRPPYTPVTFAAMGGRDRGELFDPARLTAIHERHVALGARFEDVGQWKRPWYYPAGEDMRSAVARECEAVRQRVGALDASTLGKIDIQGPDSAEFLNRVYTNNWLKLPVGRIRYGIMCRDDGMVFDDGTTSRIGEQRYLMTTTTGNAAVVLDHLEEQLQTEWRGLRVRLTSVTEQWATVGVAGPDSRRVLQKLAPAADCSAAGFPFLEWRDATVAGISARVFRISFTGELQYEINVPWHFGAALWDAVMEAGEEFAIAAYGTETMHVLRAEKGFIIVGQETDGTQTPHDLGLDWAVSDRKEFIGRRSLRRTDCMREGRKQLVGLLPKDCLASIPEGTQLVASGSSGSSPPVPMQGFVTSNYWSTALQSRICLALVQGGRRRHGEWIEAAVSGAPVPVRICDPVFYDREGSRRDGA